MAGRRAVLGGLALLGYKIQEEKEVAWAKERRIVMRCPGTDDYDPFLPSGRSACWRLG